MFKLQFSLIRRRGGSQTGTGLRQRGLTLVESLLALTVAGGAVAGLAEVTNQQSTDLRAQSAAAQMRVVREAVERYIATNSSAIIRSRTNPTTGAVTDASSVRVWTDSTAAPAASRDIQAELLAQGYLPASFRNPANANQIIPNAYGDPYLISLRVICQPPGPTPSGGWPGGVAPVCVGHGVEAVILTQERQTQDLVPAPVRTRIAALTGGQGGFVCVNGDTAQRAPSCAASGNQLIGAYGGYRIDLDAADYTDIRSAAGSGGSLGSIGAMAYVGAGGIVNDYLYRTNIGIPEANTMYTDLLMDRSTRVVFNTNVNNEVFAIGPVTTPANDNAFAIQSCTQAASAFPVCGDGSNRVFEVSTANGTLNVNTATGASTRLQVQPTAGILRFWGNNVATPGVPAANLAMIDADGSGGTTWQFTINGRAGQPALRHVATTGESNLTVFSGAGSPRFRVDGRLGTLDMFRPDGTTRVIQFNTETNGGRLELGVAATSLFFEAGDGTGSIIRNNPQTRFIRFQSPVRFEQTMEARAAADFYGVTTLRNGSSFTTENAVVSTFNGPVVTNNTLVANGPVTTNNSLTANGPVTTNSSLTANGNNVFNGPVTTQNSFTANGTNTLNGPTTFNGTARFNNRADFYSATVIRNGGSFTTEGGVTSTFNGPIVGFNATFNGTLTGNGANIFNGPTWIYNGQYLALPNTNQLVLGGVPLEQYLPRIVFRASHFVSNGGSVPRPSCPTGWRPRIYLDSQNMYAATMGTATQYLSSIFGTIVNFQLGRFSNSFWYATGSGPWQAWNGAFECNLAACTNHFFGDARMIARTYCSR